MKFGYFTLSDNAYPDNPRSANQFVAEIRAQAILADQLGYHSAWIGEHHFDSLGVNSRPGTLLASIIPETTNIRLAPAVSVLPLHHPLHVAEEWATIDLISGGRVDFAAGRGYDAREFAPFGAPFMDSAEIFEEGMEVVLKAWNSPGPWSHKGRFYDIPTMEMTPKPVQQPIPFYVASFSEHLLPPVWSMAGWSLRWRAIGKSARRGATSRAGPCAAISSILPTIPGRRTMAGSARWIIFVIVFCPPFPMTWPRHPPPCTISWISWLSCRI